MKKITYIIGILFITTFVSCVKDPTPPTANDLVGTWTCLEICKKDNTSSTFTVTISKGASNSQIIITDFAHLGSSATATATISGNNIDFASQTVSTCSLTNASGTINDKKTTINLDYTIDDGSGIVDDYSATLTK